MKELESFCPINNSCNWNFLYYSKKYQLPIYHCKTCNLKAQYPQPNNLESLYTEEYYTKQANYSYMDERSLIPFHSYTWDCRLNIIENIWKKYFGVYNKLKILEVGSSFGGFLSRAKRRGHYVQGIEISQYSSNYANQIGIPTFQGILEDFPKPNQPYQIAVLSEVLEHLPHPKNALDTISEILDSSSLIVIQTANFEGWQAIKENENYHYFLPGHLFYYSESNLIQALKIRNFTHFIKFYGSDVSLISKLKKMRGNFHNMKDYIGWIRASLYHFKSKFKWKGKPLTSGFVLYGLRGVSVTNLEREE